MTDESGAYRMMSPADHYAEAERMVKGFKDAPDQDWAARWGAQYVAAAQVHATLAATPWGVYQQAREMHPPSDARDEQAVSE